MNDVIYWIMYAVMLVSLGCNIAGCIIATRSWKRARKSWENAHEIIATIEEWRNDMRVNVAEEIFEDIWDILAVHAYRPKSEDYASGACDTLEWVDAKIVELREKYIPTEITNKGEEQ